MPPLSPWGPPTKRSCWRCHGRGQTGFWLFWWSCWQCAGRGWHYGYRTREEVREHVKHPEPEPPRLFPVYVAPREVEVARPVRNGYRRKAA